MLVFGKTVCSEVLDSFGILMPGKEMTFWGSTAVGIDRLAAFRDVDVLCFDHGNEREMQALMATPLWQAMPFVREQRFTRAPAVGSTARRCRPCTSPGCWITRWGKA